MRKLDKLEGYIAFPGNLPTALVKFRPKSRASVAAAYIPRAGIELERGDAKVPVARTSSGSAAGGPAHTSSSDSSDGGKAAEPRQGQLALGHREPNAARTRTVATRKTDAEQAQLRDGSTPDQRDALRQAKAGPGGAVHAPGGSIDPATGEGQNAPSPQGENAATHKGVAGEQALDASRAKGQPRSARRAAGKAQYLQRELADPADSQPRGARDVGDFEIDP